MHVRNCSIRATHIIFFITFQRNVTIIKKCECIDVEIAHAEMANEENLP